MGAIASAPATLLGYVGRQPGTPVRSSDSWRTPQCYIESARSVMGSIDLDPFSSKEANLHVQAHYYFSPEKSALMQRWRSASRRKQYPHGLNVWMNPPYSAELIGKVTVAFTRAVRCGDIQQAVVLVNNATETRWFQTLRDLASAVCFPTGRIAFVAEDGAQVQGNTRGQVFFYMGRSHAAFLEEFHSYGWTISQQTGWRCR